MSVPIAGDGPKVKAEEGPRDRQVSHGGDANLRIGWVPANFEIGRIQEFQIRIPEISNWTGCTTSGFDRSGDYPTKFLVFRDNCNHFVAGKQTICDDLFQPGMAFVQFLKNDPQLVNEIRAAFAPASGFLPNCCSGERNSPPKLGGVPSPNEVRCEAGWFFCKTSHWVAFGTTPPARLGSQAPS